MISDKDRTIISHLRKNARKKVTKISAEMQIPVTTIYDRIRAHENRGLLKKHVSLLDYAKMGYNANIMLALKVAKEKRDSLQSFLSNHPNINSLYRVDFGHDFIVEVVFENMSKFREFLDVTESKFNIEDTKIFTIVNEIKKEEFLSSNESNND